MVLLCPGYVPSAVTLMRILSKMKMDNRMGLAVMPFPNARCAGNPGGTAPEDGNMVLDF